MRRFAHGRRRRPSDRGLVERSRVGTGPQRSRRRRVGRGPALAGRRTTPVGAARSGRGEGTPV